VSARSKARKEVLDRLFQCDLRGISLSKISASEIDLLRDYGKEMLLGVIAHSSRIDDLIRSYIQGWDFDRIPNVDRNILRIAIWELLWSQTPEAVAIDEALKLATELSTENSPTFIHGVLSKIAGIKGQIAL
jgi:N utilization substance protein B